MTREIAWHLLVEELQVPSVNTLALLRMRRAVFQFWVIDAPATVTHDLTLFCLFKVWINRMLSLIKAISVPELLEFEVVQGAREFLLNSDFGVAEGVEREIWWVAVTTKIPSLLLTIALVDKAVVTLHRLTYHTLVELVHIGRSPTVIKIS